LKSEVFIVISIFFLISCSSDLRDKAKKMKKEPSYNKFILKCKNTAKIKGYHPRHCTAIWGKLLKLSATTSDKFNIERALQEAEKEYATLPAATKAEGEKPVSPD